MEKFSEILKKQNFIPLLKLATKVEGQAPQSTGEHIVKILETKEGKKKNYKTGQDIEAIWILVEEKGQKFKYPIPLKDDNGQPHYLLQRLAELPDDKEIILQYVRKGARGYIDARLVGEEIDGIPIIDEEENIDGGF